MRSRSPFFAVCLAAAACGARPSAPESPTTDASRLAAPLAAAFAEEAHALPTATARYLDLIDAAAASRPDGWQLAIAAASLDALVGRSIGAFESISGDAALVYRTDEPSLTAGESLGAEEHAKGTVAARLAATFAHADGPFLRGLVAEAMTELAEHRGDVDDASRWREASGCAREATVIGPLDWAALTGVQRPDPLAAFDAKIAAGYPAPGAFAVVSPPIVERGRGCSIDLSTQSSNAGVRDVVVDVDVKRGQRIGLMLRAAATATLRAGGKLVIDRPYELGGGDVSRYAWVDASPGTLRLVARVGMDQEGESVRLGAWDASGRPLVMRAPRAGEAATVAVTAGESIPYPTPRTPAEELSVALAALAAEDARTAEYILEHDASRADAPPDLALVYGRAVEDARDLTLVHRVERARTAYERALAGWPDAWEAIVAHAWLMGAKRGPGDARFAELDDLTALRAHAGGAAAPLLDLFEFAASGRQHLWDRARAVDARAHAAGGLGRTALYVEAARVAFPRAPADFVTYDCAAHPGEPHPRGSLTCYHSLHAAGDLRAGLAELERLRSLLGGVDLYLPLTLRDALAIADRDDVDRAVRDMLPAEVTLSSLYGLATLDPTRGTPSPDTRERLFRAIPSAHDAPIAIAPLWRALREDPTASFAGIAESVVSEDRAHPVLPGTATAVLRHTERYDMSPSGVVHAIVFDVRRVSGTADVEENAQASAPGLTGRTSLHILRRRVLKPDGVIVEPDPNPGASQGHADLAQLEAGDVVEAIYEAWSVPLETGEIGIDTPDLLPTRTAVHDASIEIHLPTGLKYALWAHPILGAPRTEVSGAETTLRWSLADHLARRVEDATPKMDRSVAVSLSTARWSEIGRGLSEAVAARADHDPAVLAWARDVAERAHAETDRAKVDAVVLATGLAVKEGDPGDLSDLLYGHSTGPQTTTARGILSDHEGSRTWLIVRALRELSVPCEVAVSESEPFSASADFPPHLGRFVHPLAIAHVKPDGGTGPRLDVAIDADVSGPPLPAGHISPELRGRQALREDGTISPLPEASGEEARDEIDERLTLDDHGDAHGTFTILLRGHAAQDIAEMLERNVGDQRMRSLRGVVLAWVPFANVDSVDLSSTEGSWQVALRALVTIPGYAQAAPSPGAKAGAGTTWMLPGIDPIHDVYPRGSSSTLSATYASEGTRESALAVSHAVQYHAHRRVELPAGATVVRTPGPFGVETHALTASRKLGVTAGTAPAIEDDVTLEVPTGTIPAAAYAAFVADAHRTDDAFLATILVRTPPRRLRHAEGGRVRAATIRVLA